MAINKLNLNGTTYDIGEAAGTNTAESVVEFSSADEENPSSADESVALIKSGDTHKSLLEKISAGMKNIRYLLKQVTSLNSALATLTDLSETRVTAAENVDFVANNYTDVSISVSRSGYTPIALLAAGTSSSTVFAYNLGSPSVSNDVLSSTISYRNISSSDVTGRPVYAYILWRKNS